jgi:hypothetical protein
MPQVNPKCARRGGLGYQTMLTNASGEPKKSATADITATKPPTLRFLPAGECRYNLSSSIVDIRAFSSRMRLLEFGSMEFMMLLTALTSVFNGYWYWSQEVG